MNNKVDHTVKLKKIIIKIIIKNTEINHNKMHSNKIKKKSACKNLKYMYL